jgi:hypothetical protein
MITTALSPSDPRLPPPLRSFYVPKPSKRNRWWSGLLVVVSRVTNKDDDDDDDDQEEEEASIASYFCHVLPVRKG